MRIIAHFLPVHDAFLLMRISPRVQLDRECSPTTITFSIPREAVVSLKVFNTLGEEISELINETKPAGNYSVSFDAGKLPSGVYFYKISTGNFSESKKMIYLK